MNQKKPEPKPQPKDWRDESFDDFIKKIDSAYKKK